MGRFTGLILLVCCCCAFVTAGNVRANAATIDHRHTDITMIPQAAIEQAKSSLCIAYGHTSHGSQLTTGMSGLVGFADAGGLGLSLPNQIFAWNSGGSGGALDLRDRPFSGASDLGNPDRSAWATATRNYLNSHPEVNVIIWSWCGQVSSASQADIDLYLNLMDGLERDYPGVSFVYMTGHLDGGSASGNLNQRNQQIRDFCTANGKHLYDFADIESYDPDAAMNYMALRGDDTCDYDSDGNGSRDRNWALDWQGSHTQGVDWYSCSSAHSQPLNANRKAYAAWWLWAVLAGWNPSGMNRSPVLQPIGDQQVQFDELLEFTLTATDPDGSDVLTFSASSLPNGAAFDHVTHVFNWTPVSGDEGDYQVTFSVVDDGNPQGSDQETVTISVYELVGAPPPGGTSIGGTTSSGSSSGCFMGTLLQHGILP